MADGGSKLVIVKCGGAALTDKGSYRCLREAHLNHLASSIGTTLAEHPEMRSRMIVVHGAGSFGHFEAKAARLNSSDPADFDRKTPLAVASTCASLAALNSKVLDALIRCNVAAVKIPVFPAAGFTEDTFNILSRGFTPVLHGDVILHDDLVARVVSGDEIIETLTRAALQSGAFTSVRVIFVTGASGIFTAPPQSGMDTQLLCRIYMKNSKWCAKDVEAAAAEEEPGEIYRLLAENGYVGGVVEQRIAASPADAVDGTPTTEVADTTGGISGKLFTSLRLASLEIGDVSPDSIVDVHVVGATLPVADLERLMVADAERTSLLTVVGTHIFVP
jgi:isopentenyl phosphate kinase